jgi:hypothetical protein
LALTRRRGLLVASNTATRRKNEQTLDLTKIIFLISNDDTSRGVKSGWKVPLIKKMRTGAWILEYLNFWMNKKFVESSYVTFVGYVLVITEFEVEMYEDIASTNLADTNGST